MLECLKHFPGSILLRRNPTHIPPNWGQCYGWGRLFCFPLWCVLCHRMHFSKTHQKTFWNKTYHSQVPAYTWHAQGPQVRSQGKGVVGGGRDREREGLDLGSAFIAVWGWVIWNPLDHSLLASLQHKSGIWGLGRWKWGHWTSGPGLPMVFIKGNLLSVRAWLHMWLFCQELGHTIINSNIFI